MKGDVRDAEIVMLYTGGCTLREIGGAVGLSHEQIRQIVVRNGFGGCGRMHNARIDPLVVARHCAQDKSIAAVARELGFCFLTVAKVVHALGLPYASPKRRSDEEMLTPLRQLADRLGRAPTVKEVNADNDTASQTSYHVRFGCLGNALGLIGYERRPAGHKP